MKTLASPIPSNVNPLDTMSPAIVKLVGFFKFVAVLALPVILPLIVPSISSAMIFFALTLFHLSASAPRS